MKTITIIGADSVLKSTQTLALWGSNDLEIGGPEAMSVSDGYHTFEELYDHRHTLYIALARQMAKRGTSSPLVVWRSVCHSDGKLAFGGGWFVLGIGVDPGEQITYHLPLDLWDQTGFANTLPRAPEFDGHTATDVLSRIEGLP